MKRREFLLLTLGAMLSASCSGNGPLPKVSYPMEYGPYTVSEIEKGKVYHVRDCNSAYPAGASVDKDGKSQYNNVSDMYIILSKKQALMIDLSNNVKWMDNAADYLRQAVLECIGERQLKIAITHNHGDHTGMAHAFNEDEAVTFLLPADDFDPSKVKQFPESRTIYYQNGYDIDLEGQMVHTFTLAGHTKGSTIFHLKGTDYIFTGDAIGSGSGVWIFNEASFYSYIEAFPVFKKYVYENLDVNKMTIYGGHSHQKGDREKLGKQYVDDMETLIQKMRTLDVETKPMNNGFLDTNFGYGEAWISWNKAAAEKYVESQKG